MKNSNKCSFPGCKCQDFSFWLYKWDKYCKAHYNQIFLDDLHAQYALWGGKSEPPDRLKYLIGRYYSENVTAFIGKPSLTKAIVHTRSYGWKKTKAGAVFTTIRYPINKRYGEPYANEVHQKWSFNISSMKYKFLSEEKKENLVMV